MESLTEAARAGLAELDKLIERHMAALKSESFGVVLLDPTRPRGAVTLQDRTMAAVAVGPDGARYVPSAAANADLHDRHGRSSDELLWNAHLRLGRDDIAEGGSTEYRGAIAAGSGLHQGANERVALAMLSVLVDDVSRKLQAWTLAQEKAPGDSGVWLNPGQAVPEACAFLLNPQAILTATL